MKEILKETLTSVAMFCQVKLFHSPGSILSWNLKDFDENILLKFIIYIKLQSKE